MGDAFSPEPQGAFLSFLDWIDKPGQVVRNSLKGNFSGAAKNFGDFLLDPIDAVLPGDWIPELAGKEDKVSGSQLIGVDEKEHPLLGFLSDVGVGTLTDPLTFLGGPLLRGAGKVAKAGLEASPTVKKGVETVGAFARKATGLQRMSPETRKLVDRARAAMANEKRAGLDQARYALQGLDENELGIVGDVMDNLLWKNGKAEYLAKPADRTVLGASSSAPSATDRVMLHPDVNPQNAERIRRAVDEVVKLGKAQKERPNIFSVARSPESKDVGYGVSATKRNEASLGGGLSDEYLMRQWTGQSEEQKLAEALGQRPDQMGQSSSIKELKLETPEQINAYREANPGVDFERNALKRSAARAEQQGTLAQRAELGKGLTDDSFAYADPEARQKVMEKIAVLPPEERQVALDMFKGMEGRGAFAKALNFGNGMFKKYAVYGALLPKVGSIVRNKIGGIYQSLANPEARSIAGGQAKRFGSDLADAFTQSFGPNKLSTGELTKALDQVDAAFKAGGGSSEGVLKQLPPELADAVRNGVMEGYVSSEDLIKEMLGNPKWQRAKSIIDWPGKIFQGVEQRMRLGGFLDLLKQGKSAEDAARIVKDAFYDYATTSSAQRLASDMVPFWKFASKATAQTGQLIGEKPWVGVGLSQVMQDRGDPVYPWLEGKTSIPIGADEEGNDQYITGLGLPFEAMNMIPNPSGSLEDFGRDVEKNLVGSANPLLKTAFSAISGEEPFFESQWGSYSKIPAFGEAGEGGQMYNKLAGTGMIQPIDSLLRTIDDATDPRHSYLERALDSLTGINIASVDPDRALQQQLQQELLHNPDIQQFRSFFDTTGDPKAAALLQQYQEAKKKVKAKRPQ